MQALARESHRLFRILATWRAFGVRQASVGRGDFDGTAVLGILAIHRIRLLTVLSCEL